MTRFRISLSIGAAAFGLLLAAAPAQALNRVSYVSQFTGNNGDSCVTPAAACQTILGALSKTEPGGEIMCLDNHINSSLAILKPITIDCGAPGTVIQGFDGITGDVGVIVNLNEATYPNGVVTLRNLNINGLLGNGLTSPGTNGIRVIGGGAAVHIENTTIQGFAEQGIDFAPTSSVDLFVRDTIISNNAGGGITVAPTGASSAKVVLGNVGVEGNGATGILINGATSTGAINVSVSDSEISGNTAIGIGVFEAVSGGSPSKVQAARTTISSNGGQGIYASRSLASVRVRQSVISGNTVGVQSQNGGQVISHGDNVLADNTTNGAFTATVAPQ
jgi:hypothetical protein